MQSPVNNKSQDGVQVSLTKADSTNKFSDVMKFSLFDKAMNIKNPAGVFFAVAGYILASIITSVLFFAIDYAVANHKSQKADGDGSHTPSTPGSPAHSPSASRSTSLGVNTAASINSNNEGSLTTIDEEREESNYDSSFSNSSSASFSLDGNTAAAPDPAVDKAVTAAIDTLLESYNKLKAADQVLNQSRKNHHKRLQSNARGDFEESRKFAYQAVLHSESCRHDKDPIGRLAIALFNYGPEEIKHDDQPEKKKLRTELNEALKHFSVPSSGGGAE